MNTVLWGLGIAGTSLLAWGAWLNHQPFDFRHYRIDSTTHIRLVQIIEPATPGNHGYHRLVVVPVNKLSEIQYTALSYMWHPRQFAKNEKVRFGMGASNERGIVEIGTNLYAFLIEWGQRTVHDPKSLIYIDALCINQRDDKEKADQVLLMHQVYSHAKKTIVWLNEDKDSSILLPNLQAFFSSNQKQNPKNHNTSMRHICNHDYWERLWVVQECLLSGDTEIWCGNFSFDWKDLDDMILRLDIGNSEKPHSHYEKRARVLFDTKRRLHDSQQLNFSSTYKFGLSMKDAMYLFGGQKCSDARDNVYGLLGIVKDHSIEVNYDARLDFTRLIEQVLRQVWKDIQQKDSRGTIWKRGEFNKFVNFLLDEALLFSGANKRAVLEAAGRTLREAGAT